MHPYLTLASFYNVIVCFIFLGNQRERFPEVYHIFIALHPIFEHSKLRHNIFLYLFNVHLHSLYKNTITNDGFQYFNRMITGWLYQHGGSTFYPCHQNSYFFLGVVKTKTSANRTGDFIEIHYWLGAMMTRTYRYSQF